MTTARIRDMLSMQPSGWLSKDERKKLLSWWGSKARTDRIAVIKKGMSDGTFL
jgi:hypothetical protein